MKYPIIAFALVAHHPLLAATQNQPFNFSASNAGNLYSGTSGPTPSNLVSSGFFTATVQPFNPALGSLTSFGVTYQLDGVMTGGVGNESESGAVAASLGGNFAINGIIFNGWGGGGGSLDLPYFPGETIEEPFSADPFETTLNVAAGLFHPGLLTAVTGTQPFTLAFSSGVSLSYVNVTNLAASFSATMTMVYNYETPAGSESLKIVNVIRDGTQESVSIEWTSATGKTYAVDASDGLDSWDEIATALAASTTGTTTTFVEQAVPATVARRFYRVREKE
ncbi:hypothetical protein [Luteolibacter sp. Populi]|uniref:hypothetical protein n=1 Tax=Luteolibacter sp. Populi TaxID=3230487 RepID=UPI003465BA3D